MRSVVPGSPYGSRPALAAGSIVTRFRVTGEVLTLPFGTAHLRIRQVPPLAPPGGRATDWADASRPHRPWTSGQPLQWAAAHSTFSSSQDAEHRHEIVDASVNLSNFAQREPQRQERCARGNPRGPLPLRHRTPRRHLQLQTGRRRRPEVAQRFAVNDVEAIEHFPESWLRKAIIVTRRTVERIHPWRDQQEPSTNAKHTPHLGNQAVRGWPVFNDALTKKTIDRLIPPYSRYDSSGNPRAELL